MSEKATSSKKAWATGPLLAVVVAVTALATVVVTALLIDIFDKKHEGSTQFARVVDLDETVVDPEIWGKNFPIQYQDYLRTSEFSASNHGGVLEDHDVEGDPRTTVASSKVEEDPRLKVMWNGYAFAKDYRHARGHEYMSIDQENTLRIKEASQPGACLNCHASTPSIMAELGDGDIDAGFAAMNKMPFEEASALSEHPISCVDCHDPETMDLRITRPAFMNGIAALKANEGISDYDVNRDATRQEMRSFVCAQCHVNYYFEGEDKTLTFPWDNGLDLDDTWEYFQDNDHADFQHGITEARILKPRHPEFEVWSQGVHAENGVTCADCHMNYKREGATKVSNHHLASPMEDVNASCGTCHSTGDGKLEARVATIQDRFIDSRDRAMDALVALIGDIDQAMQDGTVAPEQIALAKEYQTKASLYVDYVYSENSYGFHAPDYEQRLLSQSLDASRKGQLALKGVAAADLEPSDISEANRANSTRTVTTSVN